MKGSSMYIAGLKGDIRYYIIELIYISTVLQKRRTDNLKVGDRYAQYLSPSCFGAFKVYVYVQTIHPWKALDE